MKRKLNLFDLLNRIGFYSFIGYLAFSILMSIFANISLTLDYPQVTQFILWGFLFAAICIQLYGFYLYSQIGKGGVFLKKRSAILGTIFVLALLVYFFV